MKVLHVTNYFRGTHHHVGGAEQACYRTARMLSDSGHEVAVATKRFDAGSMTETPPFPVHPLPVVEDHLPKSFSLYVEAIKWYAIQYDPLARSSFRRLLRKERPDVVHFHNFQFLTFSLVREAFRQRIPLCLSVYDYWIFCPKAMLLRPDNSFCAEAHGTRCLPCLPKSYSSLQKRLLGIRRMIFDDCFDRVHRFVVLSGHSAGVLKRYGISEEKIRVVPLTLPLEYADSAADAPAPHISRNSILFAGWLNDRKGVHVAIDAMRYVRKAVPDAVLYVIGGRAKFSEEYERKFHSLIEKHGLKDRIVFLGHQPPQVVQQYLRKIGVLVIPEQDENMSPLIMVEAMLLGKPVVASRLGGIPEFITEGKTGFLADAYSPEEFGRKVVRLLKDPALVASVGSAARKFIREKCDSVRVARETLQLYEEMRKGRNGND
ncbi:MAG: glycosyltransferase family 4 protein [Nitrospirales bacterium]|nr:glycosyltransferase family 4 protein [Nitrospirales bacterium]